MYTTSVPPENVGIFYGFSHILRVYRNIKMEMEH